MVPIVSAEEHYDKLIKEGNDFFNDSPYLTEYMDRWTGPDFLDLLELDDNKDVLEIGIGTGRIARRVLMQGCRSLTGIDISKDSLECAGKNLLNDKRLILLEKDITQYERKHAFDRIYSVLTFCHIEDKNKAVDNICTALREKGIVLLSIDNTSSEYLDYGTRKIKMYKTDITMITKRFAYNGFQVSEVKELTSNEKGESNILVATLLKICR